MGKYKDGASRSELAKSISAEGIVLLRNNNKILPLNANKSLAVFGRGQIKTQTGGMGSGASSSTNVSTIVEGVRSLGFNIDQKLLAVYNEGILKEPTTEMPDFMELITSGVMYDIWGAYNAPIQEIPLEDEVVVAAAEKAETAIIVLSRNSGGEECDRRVEEDYYLLCSEKTLIDKVTANFKHVILILNVNGFVDTAWIDNYSNIDAILFVNLPGEAGGTAIAELLAGKVTPSGKLPATMALSYEDYPTAKHFSYNKDIPSSILTYESYGLDATANGSKGFAMSPVSVYGEGIYVGYRYFDTFGKKVMFPFGYGLSYTDFKIQNAVAKVHKNSQSISVSAEVVNIGKEYSGKEVLQVYISAPGVRLEKPYQQLIAYVKTKELSCSEKQKLTVKFSISELASYDEDTASYVIEAGEYIIRVGNSSRNTHVVAKFSVQNTIITEKLSNKLALNPENQGKIKFLTKENATPITYKDETEEINAAPSIGIITEKHVTLGSVYKNDFTKMDIAFTNFQLKDVKAGKISMEQFVSQLSEKELAVLLNGHGKGVPFGGIGLDVPDTIQYEDGSDIGINTHLTGTSNYVSPGIKRLGIASVLYKDGPAGVRITAWPVQTMMACTWNNKLLYEFGDAVGEEAESQGVDSWLAPAINLHRNPIGGRNYEYYSEDPLLSGECAVAVANGVQENHKVTVCAKHFALNEQETYRRGKATQNIDAADSIVQERVAREIYLKPFEMIVKRTKIMNLMTSFNKINGIFAGGNSELCTDILRGEWKFRGFVVTDWGDMDIVVDGADAIAAGNDVVMPGGPPVIKQVLAGLKDGRCTVEQMQRNVIKILNFVIESKSFEEMFINE